MPAEEFEVLRRHMLAEISAATAHVRDLIGKAALDERVMTAMGKVPRHEFVPLQQIGATLNTTSGAMFGQSEEHAEAPAVRMAAIPVVGHGSQQCAAARIARTVSSRGDG